MLSHDYPKIDMIGSVRSLDYPRIDMIGPVLSHDHPKIDMIGLVKSLDYPRIDMIYPVLSHDYPLLDRIGSVWSHDLPGSWYTSRKSPAAMEKLELGGTSEGSTSGNLIGLIWSPDCILLVHWCIHGYRVKLFTLWHLQYGKYCNLQSP